LKIKNRTDILNDVIRDGKKYPDGWNAFFGYDDKRFSRDLYLMNNNSGIYFLKEYDKNPFETIGIGGKIARKIDDDININTPKHHSNFGIIQGDFQKILKNLEKGINPEKILNSALSGKKNYGMSIPVRGKASSSIDFFNKINNIFPNYHRKINSRFEKIAYEDGLYRSYE
jgi:hypothetical protein